jgi:hypothetical protein
MENIPPPIFRIQNQMRRVCAMAKKSFELGFVKVRTVGDENPVFLTTWDQYVLHFSSLSHSPYYLTFELLRMLHRHPPRPWLVLLDFDRIPEHLLQLLPLNLSPFIHAVRVISDVLLRSQWSESRRIR